MNIQYICPKCKSDKEISYSYDSTIMKDMITDAQFEITIYSCPVCGFEFLTAKRIWRDI